MKSKKINIIELIENTNKKIANSKTNHVKVMFKNNPNERKWIKVVSSKDSIEMKQVDNPMPSNPSMKNAFNKASIQKFA
jgi:hypothetical protein